MDLKGLAALLWPVFAITALVKLGPELKQLIASFKGGRVAFKVAGQELTIEQAIGTIDSKLLYAPDSDQGYRHALGNRIANRVGNQRSVSSRFQLAYVP